MIHLLPLFILEICQSWSTLLLEKQRIWVRFPGSPLGMGCREGPKGARPGMPKADNDEAQTDEHWFAKPEVVGSSPIIVTTLALKLKWTRAGIRSRWVEVRILPAPLFHSNQTRRLNMTYLLMLFAAAFLLSRIEAHLSKRAR